MNGYFFAPFPFLLLSKRGYVEYDPGLAFSTNYEIVIEKNE